MALFSIYSLRGGHTLYSLVIIGTLKVELPKRWSRMQVFFFALRCFVCSTFISIAPLMYWTILISKHISGLYSSYFHKDTPLQILLPVLSITIEKSPPKSVNTLQRYCSNSGSYPHDSNKCSTWLCDLRHEKWERSSVVLARAVNEDKAVSGSIGYSHEREREREEAYASKQGYSNCSVNTAALRPMRTQYTVLTIHEKLSINTLTTAFRDSSTIRYTAFMSWPAEILDCNHDVKTRTNDDKSASFMKENTLKKALQTHQRKERK